MARLSLKQIKDGSQDISGTGIITISTGSKFQMVDAPSLGSDLANKTYVDSVAAGLDPKESVVAISATGSITTSGTLNIDGVALTVGDRILLAAQSGSVSTGHTANGIWVVSAGTWSRATDSDGTPANEVSLGNFTFVESGTSYAASGWVLASSDSTGANIVPGTDTQKWTQFSANGAYTSGAGLQLVGNQFSIVDTAAGAGLTYSNGIFDVGAGNGITVNADTIDVNYGSSINTAVQGNTAWSIAAGNGLTGDASGLIGGGISSTITVVGGTGIGVNANDVYVDGASLAGTGITWTGTQFTTTVGDITGVTAGAGLVGGGTTGFIQMDVELTNNGGLTFSAIGDAGTIEVDEANLNYTTIATNLDGAGLVANAGVLDVNLGNNGGLTFSGDALIVDTANIDFAVINTGTIDKSVTASATTADNQIAMATAIQTTPLGYVHVYVNGNMQYLTGDKLGDCYFSSDGGVTAKTLTTIANADNLYWNGSIAGFELSVNDTITLSYET